MVQSIELMMVSEAIVISGEDGCPLVGRRVGVLVLRVPQLELSICCAISSPRLSCKLEYHRGSWALKSPVMMMCGSCRK